MCDCRTYALILFYLCHFLRDSKRGRARLILTSRLLSVSFGFRLRSPRVILSGGHSPQSKFCVSKIAEGGISGRTSLRMTRVYGGFNGNTE